MKYYLAAQRQSHDIEFKNSMLWSPKKPHGKYTYNPYTIMTKVRAGDIIFSGYGNAIHAVSVAKPGKSSVRSAYTSDEISSLHKRGPWKKQGWRIDLHMSKIFNISIGGYKKILANKDYKSFNKNGGIPEDYLTPLSYQSVNLLKKIIPDNIMNEINKYEYSHKPSLTPPLFHVMGEQDTDINHPNHKRKNNHKRHKPINYEPSKARSIATTKMTNGALGEYYTCQHLQSKYKSSKYEIIGKSGIFNEKLSKHFHNIKSEIDDSFGCDYVVKNKNTHANIFIDSKATAGGPSTPFYMSPTEKDKWNDDKHVYMIYRFCYLRSRDRFTEVFINNKRNNGLNDPNYQSFNLQKTYQVKPSKKFTQKMQHGSKSRSN